MDAKCKVWEYLDRTRTRNAAGSGLFSFATPILRHLEYVDAVVVASWSDGQAVAWWGFDAHGGWWGTVCQSSNKLSGRLPRQICHDGAMPCTDR